MNVKFYRFIAKGNDKKGGGEQGTDLGCQVCYR